MRDSKSAVRLPYEYLNQAFRAIRRYTKAVRLWQSRFERFFCVRPELRLQTLPSTKKSTLLRHTLWKTARLTTIWHISACYLTRLSVPSPTLPSGTSCQGKSQMPKGVHHIRPSKLAVWTLCPRPASLPSSTPTRAFRTASALAPAPLPKAGLTMPLHSGEKHGMSGTTMITVRLLAIPADHLHS